MKSGRRSSPPCNIAYYAMKTLNRPSPINITKVRRKASTNARDVRWRSFHQKLNLTAEPGGRAFGSLFQKKLSKLEPIGKSFILGRKFTVPDAVVTKGTYLMMDLHRPDYGIALIPRR